MLIKYKFSGSAPMTLYSLVFIIGILRLSQCSLWEWQKKDKFDYIDSFMKNVNAENCRSKSMSDILLRPGTVSQIPKYNNLLSKVFYRNRTGLLHLHNLALNRAYFHSFILQKFNQSKDFPNLPGWLYLYMSVTANVNSNPNLVNGSSIYFDNNCHYPNWIGIYPFNRTLPLFAPSAWRYDDTRDSENFLHEPTLTSTKVSDMGTGYDNYTSRWSKTNIWYSLWNMPDVYKSKDSLTKYKYSVGIKYSNRPGQFISDHFNISVFFGPALPGQHSLDEELPVRFTRPYFDCKKSNEWIVSAVSPVIDFMPRYLRFTHMRRPRIVALITMDTYFRKIDFNACPLSIGNPPPNYLAGIDRCKPTTKCKHVPGFGFKRGGYKCVCNRGYKYPSYIKPPFHGTNIEQATEEEYKNGFTCTPIQHRKVQQLEKHRSLTLYMQHQRTLNIKRNIKHRTSRQRRNAYDEKLAIKVTTLMKQIGDMNKTNCHKEPPSGLSLSGSVIYGAESQFEPQARTALRLAHFLSSFLQNNEVGVNFGTMNGGQQLQEDHVFAEVLANVMSDHKILSSAVFFDSYQFIGANGKQKSLFGPWAYRKDDGWWAIDAAGLKESYLHTPWFMAEKERFKSNTKALKKFHIKAFVRSNINGTGRTRFKYSDMPYKAPTFKSGRWSGPTYRCDGRIDKWVITYTVPFFSHDSSLTVKFIGLVLVDIDLKFLDINQCQKPFYTANAFKNTALCPASTKCSPLRGFGFSLGNYACKCKQGYEYPFEDEQSWFEGVSLELEWLKKKQGEPNRLDLLQCRIAAGSHVEISLLLLILVISSNWIILSL